MSHTQTGADVLDQLNWRYAAKAFDPSKRISDQDWNALQEALRLAPSSFGLQPWRFLVVDSAEFRQRLADVAPMNRAKFETASHIVVLARLRTVSAEYVDRYFDQVATIRNVVRADLQQFRDMVVNRITVLPAQAQLQWTARQTYVALGTFLASAAQLRIDTCGMEGIDPEKFDEVLGLTSTDYATVAAVAAGYRSAEDKTQFAPKVRFEREQVFAVV